MNSSSMVGIGCFAKPETLARVLKNMVEQYILGSFEECVQDRGAKAAQTDAIKLLKPTYFTKGGDRFDASTIPEWPICQEIGCQIITGVGGGKIQSSSELVTKMKN